MMLKESFILISLAAMLSQGAMAAPTAQEKQKALEEQAAAKSAAEKKVKELEAELKILNKKNQDVTTKLKIAKLELRRAEEEVTIQKAKVARTREEVKHLAGRVVETSDAIEEAQKNLRRRAEALMNLTLLNDAEFLLDSGDAAELELRMRMLNMVAEADAGLIQRTQVRKNELQGIKSAREEQLEKLVEDEARLRHKENEVLRRKRELDDLRNKLTKETAKTKSALSEQKRMLKSINASMAKIREELKKLNKIYAKLKNAVNGPISGEVFQPIPNMDGVYIKAKVGTPVQVVAAGQVLSVTSIRGLGQTVIVGHGANETTVYSNLSAVTVKHGDKIAARGVIGKSGTSPYGDAVFFAIYKDNVPQDTLSRVR